MDSNDAGNAILQYIRALLREDTAPQVPAGYEEDGELAALCTEIRALREELLKVHAQNEKLEKEAKARNSAVKTLQESESRFKYLADHDPLTGALNRRSFMERAVMEFESHSANDIPCGVAMLDIDHFKNFNDTWGHQAGDEALRHLVRVIGNLLRQDDFLGRYGGEEFIFYFSHVDRVKGLAIAERVRKAIETGPVLLESGPVNIRASFGVAMKEDVALSPGATPAERLTKLVHYADIALYKAKERGRNRVVGYEKDLNAPVDE